MRGNGDIWCDRGPRLVIVTPHYYYYYHYCCLWLSLPWFLLVLLILLLLVLPLVLCRFSSVLQYVFTPVTSCVFRISVHRGSHRASSSHVSGSFIWRTVLLSTRVCGRSVDSYWHSPQNMSHLPQTLLIHSQAQWDDRKSGCSNRPLQRNTQGPNLNHSVCRPMGWIVLEFDVLSSHWFVSLVFRLWRGPGW